MFERKQHKNQSMEKGQTVIYQGEEESILGVEPVLIIKIKNTSHIVCGDTLLNEVCLDTV